MKKLLATILLLALAFVMPEAKAQLTAVTMTKGSAADSAIINTGTPSVTTRVLESRNVVTVQVVVTRNSGTVAGKCECMGSLNGTDFIRIATDTLKLANVTSQTYIWVVSPSKYLDYRVKCTGVGTMNARITGYLLRRKNE